jgi:hypothetical protein
MRAEERGMDISKMETTPSESGSDKSHWHILGKSLPKNEVVFFAQVIIIYTVIITCIVNLSLGKDEGKVWIALLSSCIGYLLPNPSIKPFVQKTISTD